MMSDSALAVPLRRRIIHAASWSMVGFGLTQALRLAGNLMMTRLLVPEMFGVMAVVTVVIVGLHLLSDVGLRQVVVQSSRGGRPEFLNTVWVMQIVRGALVWLIALLLSLGLTMGNRAGWLAADSVYAEPMLPLVLAVTSLSAMIAGFESTKLATATRALAQGRLILIEIAGQAAGLLVMIGWALMSRTIWALVAASIVASLVRVILSHTALPGATNRLSWDNSSAREVFGFGKWVCLSSFTGFLLNSGDRLLLGALVNAKTLGMYSIAYFIVNAVTQAVSRLNGRVSFPALSEVVRDRPTELAKAYHKLRIPLDLATLLLAGVMFSGGESLVGLLYDDRYIEAGVMLQILSLSLLAVRYDLASQCYLALGKPQLISAIIFVQLVALYAFVPLAFFRYGLEGALWVIALNFVFSLPQVLYFKTKHGLLDLKRELQTLPALPVGLALGAALNGIA